MPELPLKPCLEPGCPALTRALEGRCPTHKREETRRRNTIGGEERRETQRWYHRRRWRKLRALVLETRPLCVGCLRVGLHRVATEVDHVQPREDRPDLEYDESNLQPLCRRCHAAKTMHELRGRSVRD